METDKDSVAIIGMSTRLPRAADPAAFWQLLRDGVNAITEAPADRRYRDSAEPSSPSAHRGGFIDDVDRFDARFFGISPREASAMDPQQRLILELAWEALEDARIIPARLAGSQVGVFIGAIHDDYALLTQQRGNAAITAHSMTGTQRGIIANRVSYTLGLHGPSLIIDAAQSSSLVAVHVACQSLRAGESALAIAGGVHLNLHPGNIVNAARLGGLSPDGRCFTFDARANGYVQGEGGGVVILKPLTQARTDGDAVYCVIRGTAVNNDGATDGLTVPGQEAQEDVLRRAYRQARTDPGDAQYVELHGTGTRRGDPVEAAALGSVLGLARDARDRLLVGSAKTNIGHLEGAAGIAGLIKAALCIKHRELPPSLNFESPNPQIPLDDLRLSVNTTLRPWPRTDGPLIAGVSSFGMGGTNCHVVLTDAPAADPVPDGGGGPLPGAGVPWLVSARTAAALRAQAGRLRAWLTARPAPAADVAYSLAATRTHFGCRAAITVPGAAALDALDALASGQPAPGLYQGTATAGKTAFIFPGQGTQWPGMAAGLLETSPVFGDHIDACARALAPFTGWSLTDVLRGAPQAPPLDRVDVIQPALFAVMVSLAAVWKAMGVTPDAVAGHSQGEIAAAYIAGALTLTDAARIIALRSKAWLPLAGRGAMAAAVLPAAETAARLRRWAGQLAIAAVNGPAATVVSGDRDAITEFVAGCLADGIHARQIPGVDTAGHSCHADALRDQLRTALAPASPRPAAITFCSTVTGQPLETTMLDAAYWYRNLREPVQFEQAIRALIARGHHLFIEISPHPVLTAPVQDILTATSAPGAAIATLRRGEGTPGRFLAAVAQAHTHGAAINWHTALAPRHSHPIDLPTYPFQRHRYWLATPSSPAPSQHTTSHPLLNTTTELADADKTVFAGRLSLRTHPWLADHAAAGSVILPGAAVAEFVLHAGRCLGYDHITELALTVPVTVPAESGVDIQVVAGETDETGHRPVTVHARPDDGLAARWTCHATATLGPRPAGVSPASVMAWPPPESEAIDIDVLYDTLAREGYEYGPAFRCVRAAWRDGDDFYAEVILPDETSGADPGKDVSSFAVHPGLLDASLHVLGLTDVLGEDAQGRLLLPFSMTGITWYSGGASAVRAHITRIAAGVATVALTDTLGASIMTAESVTTRPVDRERLTGSGQEQHGYLFRLEWIPTTPHDPSPVPHSAVIGPARYQIAAAAKDAQSYSGLGPLRRAVDEGMPVPEVVFATPASGGHEVPTAVHAVATEVLGLVKDWLTDERLTSSRLVIVTREAVSVLPGEGAADLAGAPVWGLVRSAQSENPGRIVLLDIDQDPAVPAQVMAALSAGEPQLAIRAAKVYVPRLGPTTTDGALALPDGTPAWRLEVTKRGTLDNLALTACPEALAPLKQGEVRVAVRAVGLNFSDVLKALGMFPGGTGTGTGTRPGIETGLGAEGAGRVMETGPGVTDLAVGDRVMGLLPGAFGPLAVTDRRLITRIPRGWSFTEAASVPVAFLTAYHGLVDVARLRAGESVLIHAIAGGVGMAAAQLARHVGGQVFGTASPAKWASLQSLGLGIDEPRLASSRDTGFHDQFLRVTGGKGMDVVLNSLAGEFTEASLRLLSDGGRFVEIGKTGIRDPGEVAAQYAGARYQAFDLLSLDPGDTGRMLAKLMRLFRCGALRPLPVTTWDIRRAPEAFRLLSRSGHIGKIVVTLPASIDPQGTVLISGGTGTLGSLIARRLVTEHGARHLLLVSRLGLRSPGARGLRAGLAELGAKVTMAACDVADRDRLAAVLARIPARNPLTAVVHAAGVLDDGVIQSLTSDQLDRVLRPKVDAAWNLHQQTKHADLAAFVMFSSVAGLLGNPGQANYAAANAFLDALATHRRALGLPGQSLAWGLWAERSGMIGNREQADLDRMRRYGVAPLSTAEGLGLFDAALGSDQAVLVPARLRILPPAAGMTGATGMTEVPPLLRGIVGTGTRGCSRSGPVRPTETVSLGRRLAGIPEGEREGVLLELVRRHAAVVLGHATTGSVEDARPFRDMGIDSLTAVELRNRLSTATGERLHTTVIFDHPTPTALARHLREVILPDESARVIGEIDRLRTFLSGLALDDAKRRQVQIRLQQLTQWWSGSCTGPESDDNVPSDLELATEEELLDFVSKIVE